MSAILFLLLTSYVFAESNFDFSKKFSGTFNGKKLEYTAKVYEKVIFERDDSTKPLASFVVTEYSVSNQKIDQSCLVLMEVLDLHHCGCIWEF